MSLEETYMEGMVSIVIPVYNAEKTIGKTINSVINQTYQNWEMILVDDCSNDNSSAIIQQYAKLDNRIFSYLLKGNSGAAVARNYALQRIKGRYLAFLDSDDIWLPSKLEKQLEMINKDCFFVYTAIKMIDENENIIKETITVPLIVNYDCLLRNTVIATSSVLLDRKAIGEFSMPLRRSGQDYATWLMLLRNKKVAYGLNESLVLYRKSNSSLSSNKFKSIKQVYDIQTENENINCFLAMYNTFCFCVHAFKKHFIK